MLALYASRRGKRGCVGFTTSLSVAMHNGHIHRVYFVTYLAAQTASLQPHGGYPSVHLTPGLWARVFFASRHAFQWPQRPLVMSLNSVHLLYHPVTQKVKYQSKQYRYQIENETYWVDLPVQRLGSSISQHPK